jgi:hypothetical protein
MVMNEIEDGFIEYKTKSSKGLTNQGWKDYKAVLELA